MIESDNNVFSEAGTAARQACWQRQRSSAWIESQVGSDGKRMKGFGDFAPPHDWLEFFVLQVIFILDSLRWFVSLSYHTYAYNRLYLIIINGMPINGQTYITSFLIISP